MATPDLERVLRAWDAAGDLVDRGAPADPATRALAEQELGRALPEQLRAFYTACDGMSLASGDLRLHPLRGTDTGERTDGAADGATVTTAARQLREWEWPVPAELTRLATERALG